MGIKLIVLQKSRCTISACTTVDRDQENASLHGLYISDYVICKNNKYRNCRLDPELYISFLLLRPADSSCFCSVIIIIIIIIITVIIIIIIIIIYLPY